MSFFTAWFERRYPQKKEALAWVVCLSGGLLFFYEFIQLNIINSISSELMHSFHLNAIELGKLSSTYFYANVACLFLAGNLLDRFSTRCLILMAMILCTAGTFGFGLAHSAIFAGVCRTIIGVGGAFCLLSAVKLASRWFPPRRMALLTGLIVTMAFIGGWVAQAPTTFLVNLLGWRGMLMADGCLGIFITLWILFVIQDYPAHHYEKATEEYQQLKRQGLLSSISMVLRNKQNWLAGSYTCFLNLPIFLLGAMWGKMYLQQVKGLTGTQAAFVCGMLFLGSILGSPLMGLVSDKLGQRRLPMLCGAAISFVTILMILYLPGLTFGRLSVLFLLLGLVTCSQVISYPLVTEHNKPILTGTAVSIVSMTCLFGGALGLPFSGWLLDLSGGYAIINGAHVYSHAAYQHAMLIMPVAFVVGFFVAWCVKETHCRPQA